MSLNRELPRIFYYRDCLLHFKILWGVFYYVTYMLAHFSKNKTPCSIGCLWLPDLSFSVWDYVMECSVWLSRWAAQPPVIHHLCHLSLLHSKLSFELYSLTSNWPHWWWGSRFFFSQSAVGKHVTSPGSGWKEGMGRDRMDPGGSILRQDFIPSFWTLATPFHSFSDLCQLYSWGLKRPKGH